MAVALATRVTFGTPSTSPVPTPTPTLAPAPIQTLNATAQPKSRYTHYHVVPPSQRTDLPPNVIVTSVDVEAVDGMEDVGAWFEQPGDTGPIPASAPGEVGKEETRSRKIEWEVVDTEWEKRWDSFAKIGIEGWKALRVGSLVGWKVSFQTIVVCLFC